MSEIEQPVEEGQHFEHRRGQIYTVEYMNDDIVLLYDGGNYRLEDFEYFKCSIESGMFDRKPNLEITDSEITIPFEKIDWVGDEAIQSLESAGMTTPRDFDYRTDERILELDAVGEKALENITEWIENNKTDTIDI